MPTGRMTNAEVLNFSKENFEAFATSMNKMRQELKSISSQLRVTQIRAQRQEHEINELNSLLHVKTEELEKYLRRNGEFLQHERENPLPSSPRHPSSTASFNDNSPGHSHSKPVQLSSKLLPANLQPISTTTKIDDLEFRMRIIATIANTQGWKASTLIDQISIVADDPLESVVQNSIAYVLPEKPTIDDVINTILKERR